VDTVDPRRLRDDFAAGLTAFPRAAVRERGRHVVKQWRFVPVPRRGLIHDGPACRFQRRPRLSRPRGARGGTAPSTLDEGPLAPPLIPAQRTVMVGSAPLLFEEATNADGVWRLVVRSSDGVVGHIFRTVDEDGYFAGRFNALTITFRDSNLERLKKRIVVSRR
jgi:hypothetical protein